MRVDPPSSLRGSSPSDPASTRDRLLAAAGALFAERGFDGASMADIAERVGIRKASLYNYYAGKDELLFDLLGRSLAAWGEASIPPLEAPGTAEGRLREHLVATVEFTSGHPNEVAIVRVAATLIGGELGRRVGEVLHEQTHEYHARMVRFFAEAIAEGAVEPADPEELSFVWQTFVDGLLLNLIFAEPACRRLRHDLGRYWARCWRGLGGIAGATGGAQ